MYQFESRKLDIKSEKERFILYLFYMKIYDRSMNITPKSV